MTVPEPGRDSGGGVAVCVDAGTTVIKAVVFDDAGAEVAVASRSTLVEHPGPDRCEQDMDEVWSAVVAVIGEVLGRVRRPVRVITLTAQGDGAWLVDGQGRPTGPAVLWNDARGTSVVERWAADGVLDAAFAVNGSLGSAGLPHAILRVLQTEAPDRLARSQAALTCGGWLFLRLTGVLGIDRSEASAPWLDLTTGRYCDDLVELYGLTEQARLRPPLLEDHDRVQPLHREAADALGLRAGIPVVLAPYDIATTALGCGATAPGQAVCVLGTTLCTEALIAAPVLSGTPSGLTLDLGWAGMFLRAFPTLAGSGVIDWATGLLGLAQPGELSGLAASAPPGADGLAMLPYLSPAGERAPFLDTAASGLLTGLRFGHGRGHVARAVLEGLAHVVRDCLDALPSTLTPGGSPVLERPAAQLRVCGGGAASDLWCQIIADITGQDVVRTADSQVGAKGALLVALTTLGDYPDAAAAAAALVHPRDGITADPALRDVHDEAHRAFLETRALIAPGWRRHGDSQEVTRAPAAPGTYPPPADPSKVSSPGPVGAASLDVGSLDVGSTGVGARVSGTSHG